MKPWERRKASRKALRLVRRRIGTNLLQGKSSLEAIVRRVSLVFYNDSGSNKLLRTLRMCPTKFYIEEGEKALEKCIFQYVARRFLFSNKMCSCCRAAEVRTSGSKILRTQHTKARRLKKYFIVFGLSPAGELVINCICGPGKRLLCQLL